MTAQTEQTAVAVEGRSARQLRRSISATWWYLASAIVLLELFIVALSATTLIEDAASGFAVGFVAVAGLLWCAATVLPLAGYRHRTEDAPLLIWRRHLPPLLVGAAYGVVLGATSGIWTLAFLPVIQAAVLLNWPPWVRLRVVLGATALLVALAVIDGQLALGAGDDTSAPQAIFLSVLLPVLTVSELWWWDVLVKLDRARTSEARLAATQERLRLATDVHDLQGHHLQVIALQLELAERLMPKDSEAALEQLRAARVSVADAQQGTRDLATRFRSVPLSDELANAVDLLRAAGTEAEAVVSPDASLAPASALGPVIRETTTNVLRHGGGRWAQLSLNRSGQGWRYEISNDMPAASPESTGGSGLEGIARRAAAAGGELEIRREAETFTVVVTVPDSADDAG